MKESPFKHKYGPFQISWEAVWSSHDPIGGGQIKPESLRSGGVPAFSSSQTCASGLSLKRSQIDPFGTGPLHPPSEKSPLNPIPIYRVRIKGTKQPVARNQGCMGEGSHPKWPWLKGDSTSQRNRPALQQESSQANGAQWPDLIRGLQGQGYLKVSSPGGVA